MFIVTVNQINPLPSAINRLVSIQLFLVYKVNHQDTFSTNLIDFLT
ncbi:hypothetical protein [Lysinibacillus sp. 54212]